MFEQKIEMSSVWFELAISTSIDWQYNVLWPSRFDVNAVKMSSQIIPDVDQIFGT